MADKPFPVDVSPAEALRQAEVLMASQDPRAQLWLRLATVLQLRRIGDMLQEHLEGTWVPSSAEDVMGDVAQASQVNPESERHACD